LGNGKAPGLEITVLLDEVGHSPLPAPFLGDDPSDSPLASL
jgi:hypothetical protein